MLNGKAEQYRSGSMGEMMEYLELEIAAQQKQIYAAYIRIKELNHEINILKKQVPNYPTYQMEFDFNANL